MYHINDSYEAGPCHAARKETCPFFGRFGNDNHYDSYDKARRNAERISEQHLGGHLTRNTFDQNRRMIEEYMVSFGFVAPGHRLPRVRNNREIVRKWFKGDEKRYRAFKHFVNLPDKEMVLSTKQDVVTMLMRGMTVESVSKVREMRNTSDDIPTRSEITIIEERSDSVDLADLKNGSARPLVR